MDARFTKIKEILTDDNTFEAIINDLKIPFPTKKSYRIIREKLCSFLLTMREDLCVVVETNYADPVYRDSYYHHYSAKLRPYAKNCVRLSFFEPVYNKLEDFLSQNTKEVQSNYLGFLILRPLNKCIGRNVIDVKAKKDDADGIEICKTTIKSTCLGHKLSVKAFPHSSQDSEYMSCAENSIWTIMEYFGNKYTVYDPILPSQIIQTLKDYKHDRLIPTSGLSYHHISMLLKKRGFETKVYHCEDPNFKELFTCYIESGLPLITCMTGDNFGHAVVCIGRKKCDVHQFAKFEEKLINSQKKNLCYWNKHISEFVVNDDNFPNYHVMNYDNLEKDYKVKDVKISSFIVPLHEEIFVPAEIAIAISNVFVMHNPTVDNCCLRTFLTTSRSYKEYIINNNNFSVENKQQLIQLDLPKFVWITEFVDVNQQDTNNITGMLAIDATGNTRDNILEKALIFMINFGTGIYYDTQSGTFIDSINNFPVSFMRYKGNLK